MKPRTSYLLSIVVAVIPLSIALVVTWALYEYAGIGTPRKFYDLIRSSDSLRSASSYSHRSAEENYLPRWQGTEVNPLNLMVIGTSPSMHAILPEQATTLEDSLNLNVYNVARSNFRLYRCYDEISILSSLTDVDIIVLEYSLGLSSDHGLAYMAKNDAWKKQVFDDAIYDSIRAVRNVWNEEQIGPREDNADWYAHAYTESNTNWLSVVANPDEPRTRLEEYGIYRSAKQRQLKNFGYTDLNKEDVDVIRTNYVSSTVIRRIYEFCREHQIGLVIYVPPMAEELTKDFEHSPLRIAQYRYSRAALQYDARLYNIKVFDYFEHGNEEANFIDAIHMHRIPAEKFSEMFFNDLQTFLSSEEKDFSYVKVN